MSITQTIFIFVVHVLQSLGYPGIFILMMLESATLPVPSEIVLPFAGYLVYLGTFNFWVALAVASLGSLVGTLIDYFIGDYLGRAAIIRYGRYVHMNESHLLSSENWFRKYGSITVLFARFVPLIRTLVAFPAGLAKMSLKSFIAFSVIGIVVYDAILIYIGLIVGPSVNGIINALSSDFTVVEVLAIVVACIVLYLWLRPKKKNNTMLRKETSDSKPPERGSLS